MMIMMARTAARQSSASARRAMSSTVYSWGTGDDGQLGQPSVEKAGLRQTYVELAPRVVEGLEGQNVVDLAAGFKHSAAATEDGRVLTWGKGKEDTLLGHDGAEGGLCLRPTHVAEGLEGVHATQVCCGEDHTAVLSADGDVFTWGSGGSFMKGASALGHGDAKARARPERVLFGGSNEVKLAKVASGRTHMLGLGVEGELWTWGSGKNGRLGNGGNTDQLEPFPVDYFLEIDEKCVDIACGNSFCLALTEGGQVYGWGKNDQSQLGLGGGIAMDMYAMEDMPRQAEGLDNERIVAIGAGGSHALAINDKGEVYFWGMRLWMEPHKMTALSGHRIVQADCGDGFSAVLSDAGQLFTWGKGIMTRQSGVMGHGDTSRRAQPELVESLANMSLRKVACGNRHALAVTGMPPLSSQ